MAHRSTCRTGSRLPGDAGNNTACCAPSSSCGACASPTGSAPTPTSLRCVMTATNADTRLIVFAKAPQPGAVKTRLIPLLGEAGAAALQARLVERTLATACAAGVGPVELYCAPRAEDPFFEYCGGRYAVSLASQADGDLGARMRDAFARVLSVARHAILIGTDCPALT